MSTAISPRVRFLLDTLLAQADDHALLLYDAEERIVWASAGAGRILGREPADFIGRHNREIFVPEDIEAGIPDLEFRIARNHASSEDDRWTMRADGSRFWAMGLAYALRDDDGKLIGYGKILQNRTPWRQQQDTLKNQTAALAARDEQKNLLIATLAHEIRSPLGPLINAAHLLRKGTPVEYAVQLIERQVDYIGRLVEDLLEATRTASGKVQLRVGRVVLQEVIARAVETVRPKIENRRQHLDVVAPEATILLDGDAVRLQQVFVNLLTNASKYSPEDAPIWVEATVEGAEAVVRIEDKGAGIPPEMLDSIFDLFTQAEAPAHGERGLGIGLSVVKELVTLHGGSVQANSDGVGKGSKFIVRLPAAALGLPGGGAG